MQDEAEAQQQVHQDHVWFPSLQGAAAGVARKQLGLDADISSKVSGPSRHVPSPADWAAADHAVAPPATMVILPGCPHPVPLQSLLAAGFLQQPGVVAAGQQLTADTGVPAAAGAGFASMSAAAAAAAAESSARSSSTGSRQPDQAGSSLTVARKAAMAKGLSAAAAGSGAVASPTPKLAASAANAAVAAATAAAVQAVKDLKGQRGGSKKKKADVAVAIASAAAAKAAASAAVAAVHKSSKVVSVLPTLGNASSAVKVWEYYTCGFNGGRPWEALEREQGRKPVWRQGERKVWFVLNAVIKEVQYRVKVWGVSHGTAAAALDSERPKGLTFCQWVRDHLVKAQQERGEAQRMQGSMQRLQQPQQQHRQHRQQLLQLMRLLQQLLRFSLLQWDRTATSVGDGGAARWSFLGFEVCSNVSWVLCVRFLGR